LIRDYNFILIDEVETDFDFISIYRKPGIRIHLDYDVRDNFFYFTLIRGDDTRFPNDKDKENIKSFLMLFKKYDPNFDSKKIQPDDKQYIKSLEQNAILLRKFGDKVLKGDEWF
jgi:hypothetical protein